MEFQSQIDDDVRFSTGWCTLNRPLLEVEEWSRYHDIYQNGKRIRYVSDANITNKAILDVVSWVEGDEEFRW